MRHQPPRVVRTAPHRGVELRDRARHCRQRSCVVGIRHRINRMDLIILQFRLQQPVADVSVPVRRFITWWGVAVGQR